MRYLAVSRRWIEDYHLDTTILGLSHYEIFPEICEQWKDVHRRALNGEVISNHEERFVRRDGSVQWLIWVVRPWHDANGRIGGIVIQTEDISARKEAEQTLKMEREIFEQLANMSSDYFWEIDSQFRFRNISRTIAERSGLDYESYIGKARWDLPFIGISDDQWNEHRSTLRAHRPFRNLEGGLVNLRGELRYFLMSGDPVFSPDGEFTGYRGVTHDITERRQSEDALRRVARELDDLYNSAPLGYHSVDTDGQFVRINDKELSWLGYTRDELIGKKRWTDIAIRDENEKGHSNSIPYTVARRDGTTFPALLSETPIYDAEGRIRTIHGMVVDNTERAKASAVLRESEARYRALFENMNAGFVLFEVVHDPHGNPQDLVILAGNETFARTTGTKVSDVIGRRLTEVVPGIERDEANWIGTYAHVAMTGESRRFEQESRLLGRTYAVTAYQPVPTQCAVTFQDITELKEAQDKLSASYTRLKSSMRQTLLAVSNVVEMRDPYTAGHARRVGLIASEIARHMKWSEDACYELQLIGLVHDIGKISLPAEFLSKPDRLTDLEFAIVKRHAQAGFEILREVDLPSPVAEIIYQHHERMNGSGYPRCLKGDQILPEARILAVADVVEAMSSDRPYRSGKGLEAAMTEIEKNRDVLYDGAVVDALVALIRTRGYQIPK